MTDRPIIFSAPMIRALLEGRKTQTRRILKPKKGVTIADFETCEPHASGIGNWMRIGRDMVQEPRFAPGDRLWVRESWSHSRDGVWSISDARLCGPGGALYAADGHYAKWFPSIHMPREFSRLTLIVESVKVERLQAMNRGDAMEEGCPFPNMANGENPIEWFRALWTVIHGAGSWDANPFVAAISFSVIKANIDALAKDSP